VRHSKETLGRNSKATQIQSYKTTGVCAGLYGYELGVTTDCAKKTIQISEIMFLRHVDEVRLLGCETNGKTTTREKD
jgi:hypothetical protein